MATDQSMTALRQALDDARDALERAVAAFAEITPEDGGEAFGPSGEPFEADYPAPDADLNPNGLPDHFCPRSDQHDAHEWGRPEGPNADDVQSWCHGIPF